MQIRREVSTTTAAREHVRQLAGGAAASGITCVNLACVIIQQICSRMSREDELLCEIWRSAAACPLGADCCRRLTLDGIGAHGLADLDGSLVVVLESSTFILRAAHCSTWFKHEFILRAAHCSTWPH
ncbi:hypothetical protein EJB05_30339, partial [Eragrostis curvula]